MIFLLVVLISVWLGMCIELRSLIKLQKKVGYMIKNIYIFHVSI